jgi:hypothetical protein
MSRILKPSKVFDLRIFIVFISLFPLALFGQDNKPTYYCQTCCGGVNIYYLKLDNDGKFECYYQAKQVKNLVSFFGIGKFDETNEDLTLSFEDIPADGIDVEKVGESTLVIIYFRIQDNLHGDSLMTNIGFSRSSSKSFFCNKQECIINTRFIPNEKITFSAIGFKSLIYTLTKPGEYRMRVRLNPEGDVYFKKGELKQLRKHKTNYGLELVDGNNRKINFTNKSCRR